eukprot:Gb_35047 [translate_table: standard]
MWGHFKQVFTLIFQVPREVIHPLTEFPHGENRQTGNENSVQPNAWERWSYYPWDVALYFSHFPGSERSNSSTFGISVMEKTEKTDKQAMKMASNQILGNDGVIILGMLLCFSFSKCSTRLFCNMKFRSNTTKAASTHFHVFYAQGNLADITSFSNVLENYCMEIKCKK